MYETCVFLLPAGWNAEIIAGAQVAVLTYEVGASYAER